MLKTLKTLKQNHLDKLSKKRDDFTSDVLEWILSDPSPLSFKKFHKLKNKLRDI